MVIAKMHLALVASFLLVFLSGAQGQEVMCTPDVEGIRAGVACCPVSCGLCGGDGCGTRESGSEQFSATEACCSGAETGVRSLGRDCSSTEAPCIVTEEEDGDADGVTPVGPGLAPSLEPSLTPTTPDPSADSPCVPEYSGDGFCDTENNNASCGFDGGDCCEDSCVDGPNHICNEVIDDAGGFNCLDPNFGQEMMCTPDVEGIRAGVACCPVSCGLCGGDGCGTRDSGSEQFSATEACCSGAETGVRSLGRDCSSTEAPCIVTEEEDGDTDGVTPVGPGLAPSLEPSLTPTTPEASPDSPCLPEYSGDGFCDTENNNASCGFDGGDCCEESCVDGPNHICNEVIDDAGGFNCLDPNIACFPEYSGDGFCDTDQNIASCGFDGGDCCEASCVDGPNHICNEVIDDAGGFNCLDPDFAGDSPAPAPEEPAPADQTCSDGTVGIEHSSGEVCCPLECGACGGQSCRQLGGNLGREFCCAGGILEAGVYCGDNDQDAPCIIRSS